MKQNSETSDVKTVLFVCVHNSGRSQMAEAFFNQLAKGKAAGSAADHECRSDCFAQPLPSQSGAVDQ